MRALGLMEARRGHAEVENTIRDLKYGGGLNHVPSGRFAATAPGLPSTSSPTTWPVDRPGRTWRDTRLHQDVAITPVRWGMKQPTASRSAGACGLGEPSAQRDLERKC